jgi:hypothetical protein
MSKDNLDYLLKRLISPSSVHVVGAYTIPETYGRVPRHGQPQLGA